MLMIRCSTGAKGSPLPDCTTPSYLKSTAVCSAGLLLRGARVLHILAPHFFSPLSPACS